MSGLVGQILRWALGGRGQFVQLGGTMRWQTDWWGIEFVAETPSDEALLVALDLLLSDKAEGHVYETGGKKLIREDCGELSLSFGR